MHLSCKIIFLISVFAFTSLSASDVSNVDQAIVHVQQHLHQARLDLMHEEVNSQQFMYEEADKYQKHLKKAEELKHQIKKLQERLDTLESQRTLFQKEPTSGSPSA